MGKFFKKGKKNNGEEQKIDARAVLIYLLG